MALEAKERASVLNELALRILEALSRSLGSVSGNRCTFPHMMAALDTIEAVAHALMAIAAVSWLCLKAVSKCLS